MTKKRAAKPSKSKQVLFIGSSVESLPIADAIELDMQHVFDVKKWTAGVFDPSSWPLADLEKQAKTTSFGVFVFGRDDVVETRGETFDSTRDNVIFELGLFAGRLGRENCFVVVPKERDGLHLPSDLEGLELLTYDEERTATDVRAAMSPTCSMIRLAIRERPSTTTAVFSPDKLSQQQLTESRIFKYVEDALQLISKGRAGLTVATKNETQLRIWRQTVLKMALDAVKDQRPPDVYTIWLKPIDEPDILVPYLSENFPAYDEHYKFGRREGLAGNVWALGQAAIHSQTLPHPKWTIRAGCDNASYIAVPVGEGGGVGGVLAVGSDSGFEPTEDDVRVLRLYAAVLAVSV